MFWAGGEGRGAGGRGGGPPSRVLSVGAGQGRLLRGHSGQLREACLNRLQLSPPHVLYVHFVSVRWSHPQLPPCSSGGSARADVRVCVVELGPLQVAHSGARGVNDVCWLLSAAPEGLKAGLARSRSSLLLDGRTDGRTKGWMKSGALARIS